MDNMKIFDSHVHIGGTKLGFDMTEEMVSEMIDKYNISKILVSNCDSAEVDHDLNPIPMEYQVNQIESLERAIKFARGYKDRVYVAAWIKPLGEKITDEFEAMIKDNLDIIKAIKIHPFHSNTSPVDEKCIPYLELASKYKLAVVSHTGGCEAASPVHLYEAAVKYPDIPFVMVHMGLGTDNTEALNLLGKADNLYGDTTWVKTDVTKKAIEMYGGKKMLFGSDSPIDGLDTYMYNKTGDPSIYREYMNGFEKEIGNDNYNLLMYENSCRIFGV